MDPLNHTLIGLLVYRFRRGWPAFLLGAIAPDMPLFVAGIMHLAEGGGTRHAYELIMEQMWVRAADNWTHSLVVAVALLAVGYLSRSLHFKAFAMGWLLHSAIDLATHADDATPPLWPFSQRTLRSPISYWQWIISRDLSRY